MKKVSGETLSIKIECLGCHEIIDYSILLPTAIVCDKCGMISEARLSLLRKQRLDGISHKHHATAKRKINNRKPV